jgi:ankyrin repeat protein
MLCLRARGVLQQRVSAKAWAVHKPICKCNRAAKKARDEEAKEAARVKEAAKARAAEITGDSSGLGYIGSLLNSLNVVLPKIYRDQDTFDLSAGGKHEELVRSLQRRNLNINWTSPTQHRTAAYAAANDGHAVCLATLVSHHADLNIMSDEHAQRWAPIHAASQNGHYECLDILINNGVNVNEHSADSFGDTPLYLASGLGHLKCMAFLIDKGMFLID